MVAGGLAPAFVGFGDPVAIGTFGLVEEVDVTGAPVEELEVDTTSPLSLVDVAWAEDESVEDIVVGSGSAVGESTGGLGVGRGGSCTVPDWLPDDAEVGSGPTAGESSGSLGMGRVGPCNIVLADRLPDDIAELDIGCREALNVPEAEPGDWRLVGMDVVFSFVPSGDDESGRRGVEMTSARDVESTDNELLLGTDGRRLGSS